MNGMMKILTAETHGDLTLGKQVANFAINNRKNKLALGIGAVGIFSLLSTARKDMTKIGPNNQGSPQR